jgi:alpha-L-fucosidase
MRKSLLFSLFLFIPFLVMTQIAEKNVILPLPSKVQLRFQNYEQIMFLCIDPATWQGREFDDLSTPLERINPVKLNTDQWCEVAKSWDAKLILFVAKHVGGFCWWQTNTTEYSVKNTPWKNGKGDVIKELSQSCKKYGLDFGIYVYPGDPHFDAPLGSGGVTKDPAKQEAYNQIYCRQMTEVLSRYGKIREVWFDGNCHIKGVNEILEKYASDAVIMAGPLNNIREVGNEEGYAPFSNWNTLSAENLKKGVADAIQSDPFGDAYAPIETCVPLLRNKGHKWFWGVNTDHLILTDEQLMNMYYKSVGRGAVLLLNATPDTTGLIPESHVAAYREFGKEIKRRFDNPLKRTKGEGNGLEMTFSNPTEINHVILQEDLSKGQRVLAFEIKGMNEKEEWNMLYDGTSVGQKRICLFNPVTVKKIKVSFTNVKAKPQISNFAVYNIAGIKPEPEKRKDNSRYYNFIANKKGTDQTDEPVIEIGKWDVKSATSNQWKEISIDLTKYVTQTGQYEVTFSALDKNQASGLEFKEWEMEMYGGRRTDTIELLEESSTFRITRSQQTLDEFPTILSVKIRSKSEPASGNMNIRRITY